MIKLIDRDSLLEFINLYCKMQRDMGTGTDPEILKQVVYDMENNNHFMANGLFLDANLGGFISGFGISIETYYISSIYLREEIRGKRHMTALIKSTMKIINDLGYKYIETNLLNGDIKYIIDSLNGEKMYTRYRIKVQND